MADLPVKRAAYNAGLIPVLRDNLNAVSTSTEAQAGEKLATLQVLKNADEILGNLDRSNLSWAFTGSTATGLSFGSGLGYQIPVTAYQIEATDDNLYHIYLPEVNSVWPTASSQLQSLLYTTQSIKLEYYLAYPESKFQTFTNSGSSVAVGTVVKETATSAAGNVSAAVVTATTDNAWGIVFCGPLGQSGSIAGSAQGIVRRGGFFNSGSAIGGVGALYFTAAGALTLSTGSAQIGKVFVDAGGGVQLMGQIRLDF